MSKVSLGVPPRPPEGLQGGLQRGAARIDLLKDVTMMIRQFLVQDQHFIICDSDDIFIPCTYIFIHKHFF